MPIHYDLKDGVVYTILADCVTDEDILSYYQQPFFEDSKSPWREVVDGRKITDMQITPDGQRRLAELVAKKADKLKGGRVAMVATRDLTYGMFRMWEVQRGNIDYEVRVFRDFNKALEWIMLPHGKR